MTTTAPVDDALFVPTGSSRGTIVVLAGRGEHPGVYTRLGTRLAADGYTVVVPAAQDAAPAAFTAHPEGLRVLLGSDTGALGAWTLAGERPDDVDALVLAGLPLAPGTVPPGTDRDAELDLRTRCPVHRARLADDPTFTWGLLDTDAPAPATALPAAPTLLLHGEADRVAPLAPVQRLAASAPAATLAVIGDAVHDVLNDRFHRSAAARLVLFLEEIGKGARVRDDGSEASPRVRARRAAPVHVSARLDYALRAICALPDDPAAEPVRCEAIARARGIPLNSLVNLMPELRRAGLVHSRRGCEGGYWLARPAATITVADVVRAVEDDIATTPDAAPWMELAGAALDVLGHRTVEHLRSPLEDPR